jgi:hypothetical protein
MGKYDHDHNKIFGVSRVLIEGEMRVESNLIEKSLDLVASLVASSQFSALHLMSETQEITFFPSRELALDFLDEICTPNRAEA